ncbi:MFS-type transporter SLC18B1 isoform X2 [Clupea harengus]|uniref:MFS-type transporter SLC18B1 isoform X2 n=1 Tax=Clupea harengus TaxID=7950 RepID=A0A6P3WA76_CLUHA|nr:MFS-type transporter SLC18B1 isoform X2 [Clupea harengus]
MDSKNVSWTGGGAQEEPPAPSQRLSRQQILTMIAMSSINFSSMICYSILAPFFPSEAKKKGVNQTMIGLIFGWYALFVLVGSLLLGKYIVQIGAKTMIILGIFVSAVCTILFGLLDRAAAGTQFIVLCFVIRSVNAVGFAAAMTASFAILAKVFPNNIATVLGFMEIFTGLGLILGPPIGGWLYQAFGYEIPFIVLGCLLFLMVPFNIWLLPSQDAYPTGDSFFRLCAIGKIPIICFVVLTLSSGLGFLDATLSIFAIEKFSLSPGSVGLLMIGLSLPYAAASPIFGILSDKYPSARKWMMVSGGMGTAVSFCLLGPVPVIGVSGQLWLTIVMLVVIGFSLCMTAIPTFAEMLICAHENGFEEGLSTLGLVSGLFSAVWSCGMFVGPTFGSYITQKYNFEYASACQGGLTFLAASLQGIYSLYDLHRRRSTQASEPVTDDPAQPGDRTPLLSSFHSSRSL